MEQKRRKTNSNNASELFDIQLLSVDEVGERVGLLGLVALRGWRRRHLARLGGHGGERSRAKGFGRHGSGRRERR